MPGSERRWRASYRWSSKCQLDAKEAEKIAGKDRGRVLSSAETDEILGPLVPR